ncbi:TonB-dependent siderophore receptor [Massilia sp. TS11]|uniref:TonB-dependent receptor plug domain-containing protein n=1 Tax=Massilia sp. TS11 TaxID=2908003 RepID=UPI001EDB68CA|nr:TonB-dependent receptor [Massilia sp. TS11]MCG2584503.1 TonB-dependent receptor [Massilia sp. TS11]
MPSTPFRLTLGAAIVLAAFSAQAQQATSAAPDSKEKLQQVEVKGTAANYDPRRDDTASKIVINHEEIIKYGDTMVTDVLKRLPGVTVGGGAGRMGGEVRMRGLGAGYTQVLINGERAPIGFSLDSISPDLIERIEVQRAASAEFSTQAVAGTINIVLKRAISTQQREAKPSFMAGHGVLSPSTSIQLSDRMGKMSYSLAVNGIYQEQDRENPATEEGTDAKGKPNLSRVTSNREKGNFRGLFIVPRLNWSLENGDALVSQSFIGMNRVHGNGHTNTVTTLGAPSVTPNLDYRNTVEFASLRTDLTWTHKIEGGGKLDAKIGVNLQSVDTTTHQWGHTQSGGPLILDRAIDTNGREHGLSTTGKYLSAAMEGHSLAFGWDGGYSKRSDENLQVDLPIPGYKPFNINENSDATVSRFATFVQDEWNVTPRWSVYTGVRWEGIQTKTTGNTFGTIENKSSVWSPVFQTLFKLPDSKGDQIRFALTRTYKAPATQSLTPRRSLSTNNSPTEPDRQGNPNLKPELALGLDASYEHYFAEGGLLSASVSTRRITDYTRQGLILDNGRWVSLPVNEGRANTHSLELEAKFPLRLVFEGAPAIDFRWNIARNWSRVESVPGPDNRLDQQTPLSSTLGLDYKDGALSMGGSLTFRNGGFVRISNTTSGYQSVRRDLDLYALLKTGPKTQWRFAVQNLLQQDLHNANIYADANGSDTRVATLPGHATARVTYEVKF